MKKETIKWLIILHVIILIYALNSICAKIASQNEIFSPRWILFYGIMICILGFYAIAWQQVLKHLSLITTYANKAATTIWGLILGFLVFGEQITLQKVFGAVIVIIGVYLVVSGDEEVKEDKKTAEEVSKNE